MSETTNVGYLSIGEVLGLLLEEFPDITISKIRFLESQGLISPERTASGYRKFYDDDVQLLRVILTEQHQNYLPLRVIKDRLDSGEIDPTGEHLRPNGSQPAAAEPATADPVAPGASSLAREVGGGDHEQHDDHTPAEIPTASIRSHPASRGRAEPEPSAPSAHRVEPEPVAAQLLPGVVLDRSELCAMVGMTDEELSELESYGIVSARKGGSAPTYGDDAVAIARPATEFLRMGIEARHLRAWRTAADREASPFE
jgi:DNA-binding transcriptional MerR regulator